MGYYSTVRGQITVSPAINVGELRSNPSLRPYIDMDADTILIFEGFDEGVLDSEFVDTISARWEGQIKAYTLVEELTELVDTLSNATYDGYLEIEGEGDGSGEPDLWRLRVRNGEVQETHPILVWPED